MFFEQMTQTIKRQFPSLQLNFRFEHDFTLEIVQDINYSENILILFAYLKNEPTIACKQLIDLCGVDYLQYGKSEWDTKKATSHGFSRAINNQLDLNNHLAPDLAKILSTSRFAVVYHLLSHFHNLRIRIKIFLTSTDLSLLSCISIWPSANWYEREVFDLFGIKFEGHPNLTKILTEDNLAGFPLRKDFPLSGDTEIRFDAGAQAIVHEPISIDEYNVVPKVIR